ncbi:nuclear protein localization protein 4 [Lobulomyces angularis]|nr:nuclear protein localization protein 4 [Lobulomyces angularis]
MTGTLIVRLETPEGRSRLTVDSSLPVKHLIKQINPNNYYIIKNLTYNSEEEILSNVLKNGQQIKLENNPIAKKPSNTDLNKNNENIIQKKFHFLLQDPVDEVLEKCDGKIPRKKNPQLKLQVNQKNLTHFPALDGINLKVDLHCKGNHAPWPNGICSKCQPSAVTLATQIFRMLDHVEFDDSQIIENFISFWRSSGVQRFGYMYGTYETYDKVPLGVKAVVSFIYEPKQECYTDGVQLILPDPQEAEIERLTQKLGLKRVGMIYTDLLDDGEGKAVCKRHEDSYFLSSAEAIFIAKAQLEKPVYTKYSSVGHFSSRFVTCIVTAQKYFKGDHEKNIGLSCYQVSNVAEAMVRDEIIEASVEPSLMRVKESTSKAYIPEVFYKYNNEYKVNVQEAAKPTFPVDYLLITQTNGFPLNPTPKFQSKNFVQENREHYVVNGEQNFKKFKSIFKDCFQKFGEEVKLINEDEFRKKLSDGHLLLFLNNCGLLDQNDMDYLIQFLKGGSYEELENNSNGWRTLLFVHFGTEESPKENGLNESATSSNSASKNGFTCRHCTFVNGSGRDSCEMCGLPPN